MMWRGRFALVILLVLLVQHGECWNGKVQGGGGGTFVSTSGTHFMKNGKPLYLNGFNGFWLMDVAYDPGQREKVTTTFQQASTYGMNVVRTWAFSDGGSKPMQFTPGVYSEEMFKALDFVISEAKKYGVYLIPSLVNNWSDYGGKKQYVQWGREHGQYINNDDDFYTNSMIKGYYKNHIKAVLTRKNTITGIMYKDDPAIFAWELMNEPRCQNDLSGKSIQSWIEEMAAYVKSIDSNHLLEIGLEGFYGESMPEKKVFNIGYQFGTDFIANNQVTGVDFATIHLYPDKWMRASEEAQKAFAEIWVSAHTQDSSSILKKPLVLAEFGQSKYSVDKRDAFLSSLYEFIYNSAKNGGACVGGIFWHVLAQGMENYGDGYEVVLADSPSTTSVIAQQSHMLSTLTQMHEVNWDIIVYSHRLPYQYYRWDSRVFLLAPRTPNGLFNVYVRANSFKPSSSSVFSSSQLIALSLLLFSFLYEFSFSPIIL